MLQHFLYVRIMYEAFIMIEWCFFHMRYKMFPVEVTVNWLAHPIWIDAWIRNYGYYLLNEHKYLNRSVLFDISRRALLQAYTALAQSIYYIKLYIRGEILLKGKCLIS